MKTIATTIFILVFSLFITYIGFSFAFYDFGWAPKVLIEDRVGFIVSYICVGLIVFIPFVESYSNN